MLSEKPTYAFDQFTLDPRKRLLTRRGTPVPLTGRAFDILLLLIEERHRIVPKEELLARVWGGVVVEESNLFRQISRIRRALGERPDEHRYLVTVPNDGYRFVGLIADAVPAATLSAPETVLPADEPVAQVKPSRKIDWWIGAGAAAAVTLSAFALRGGPQEARTPVLQQVSFDEGFPREATWSPDGQSIAYTSDRSGNPDIWLRRLDRHDSVQLTNSPSAETSPAWSPDGRLIAYRSTRDGGGLFVATTEGSEERRISSFGDLPQWSPDGSQLLFTWRAGEGTGALAVYVVGLDGGAPHVARPDLLDDVGVVAAAWHPTGLVSVLGARDGQPLMLLAPLTDGAPRYALTSQAFRDRLAPLGLSLGRYTWSPSGDQLYFEGSNGVENLWRVTIDPATYDVVRGPDRLTVGAGIDRHLALSPDGNRLIFDIRSSRTQLWSFGFDAARRVLTSAGRRVTSGVPGELNADATSDGRKFVYRATRGDLQEVWEHSLASGVDRLLFKGVGGNFSQPRWSPDGRTLAFSREQPVETGPASSRELVLLTSLDNRVRTYPLGHSVVFRPTDWFADARTILGSCRPNPSQLSAVCLTTTPDGDSLSANVRVIASDPHRELFNARLSPDQQWILFQALDRRPQGTSTLFVMAASGGPWLPTTDPRVFADKPHWSPDGQTILFVSDRSGSLNVWAQPFDLSSGKPLGGAFQVTSFDSERQMISSNLSDMDLAITRDQLLLPIAESTGQLWTLGDLNK